MIRRSFPTTRPLRVLGTVQRALNLGLLVLRLESYLTESVELAYTFDNVEAMSRNQNGGNMPVRLMQDLVFS